MCRVSQSGLELDPQEKGLLAAVAKTEKALAKQKAGKEAILLGSSHFNKVNAIPVISELRL